MYRGNEKEKFAKKLVELLGKVYRDEVDVGKVSATIDALLVGHRSSESTIVASEVVPLKVQLAKLERESIIRALGATGGNRKVAAAMLAISPRSLFYKLKRYEIA